MFGDILNPGEPDLGNEVPYGPNDALGLSEDSPPTPQHTRASGGFV